MLCVLICAIVGGIALLFFICALILFSRRRRAARRFQLAAIPRPHVGEQPYVGPQQYGPPGSGPYMQQNQAPWQQPYPSAQTPYPSQQPPVGVKPQDDQLPAYSKEKDYATHPNNVSFRFLSELCRGSDSYTRSPFNHHRPSTPQYVRPRVLRFRLADFLSGSK